MRIFFFAMVSRPWLTAHIEERQDRKTVVTLFSSCASLFPSCVSSFARQNLEGRLNAPGPMGHPGKL